MKSLPRTIGVIHLAPLPGSPGASNLDPSEALVRAGLQAVEEAQILVKHGFDGIILENFGDAPFFKTQVGPETIASMAIIAAAVRESIDVPLGINVLRNDANSALAIAAVVGADFIRVNVLSGVTATDQGIIEGNAAVLVRERLRLNANSVAILADVHVKHGQSLSSSNMALAIEETAGRGGADAIIITGATTGRSPDENLLLQAREAANHLRVPLYIGSGTTPEALPQYGSLSLGLIVGSTLRKNGKAGAPLDSKRLKTFAAALKNARKKNGTKSKKQKSKKTARRAAR